MRTLGLALAVILLWAGGAQARREQTYPYAFSRVWTAAVRMLRVDFESAITEKDKDSGYFFFSFADANKLHPGSFEVIRVQETSGIETVRVVVQVPALPSYVEQMLLDHLTRKLGQDYGQPPQPKAPPPTTGAGPVEGARSDTSATVREQTQTPKAGTKSAESGKQAESGASNK
jgi:hypothetical protein